MQGKRARAMFAPRTSAHADEFITSTPLLAAHPGCSHKNRARPALTWINSQFPERDDAARTLLHCTLPMRACQDRQRVWRPYCLGI
jgi:hypothetical protein